jgi:hypothetical protein
MHCYVHDCTSTLRIWKVCLHSNIVSELQISCVFAFLALRKRVKTHVLSDQSVHITHTYCCVSKLSKFGAYLYADNTVVYINNTLLSLRNSPQLLLFILFEGESVYLRTTCSQIYFRFSSYLLRKPLLRRSTAFICNIDRDWMIVYTLRIHIAV